MTHVDIVKNEWLAGYQVVIGRVWVEDGVLRPEASEPATASLIDHGIAELGDEDPDRAISALHTVIHGDYVFATEAHDEANCQYQHAMVIPLQAEDPQAAAHA